MRFASKFQLLIVEFNDIENRDKLVERINDVVAANDLHPTSLTLSLERFTDFPTVERALVELASTYEAVHVFGGEVWFDERRWQAFNLRREAIASAARTRIVLWLTLDSVGAMAQMAPDLWAWRGGVYSFASSTSSGEC